MSDERATWRIAGIAILGLALAAFVLGSNPANFPESWIERWLRHELPAGSSIVAVRNTIEKEGWTTADEWVLDTGSVVLVHIGIAWFPRRYVYAFLSVDRFGRLVSVRVQKDRAPWEPTGGKSVPVD
jgi:hypothetical protein